MQYVVDIKIPIAVPEWAEYVAIDEDGELHAYDNMPTLVPYGDAKIWSYEGRCEYLGAIDLGGDFAPDFPFPERTLNNVRRQVQRQAIKQALESDEQT